MKQKKQKTKRKKGDPGTKAHLSMVDRRNKIKRFLLDGKTLDSLAKDLKVSRSTIIRDLRAIRQETLDKLKEISREEIFLEFLDDLGEDQLKLKEIIESASRDIDRLDPEQRSTLYNAITQAVRTRSRNRARAIQIGQTLGIYPMVRPGIDINITYEEKKELTLTIIEVIAPTILKYIPRPEDQRRAAREIDQRATQFLREPDIARAGQGNQKHKR